MNLSMFSWLVPIVMAALLTGEARAWGTKTEDQKKSDRFFKCLLAIEGADIDQDNRLDSTEYDTFVDHYSVLLFDESMSKVPKDIQSLYKALVAKSEAPKGEDLIDVFGANFFDLANVDETRIKALHAICESVARAIVNHGHQTEAPVMMKLDKLLQDEGDGDN